MGVYKITLSLWTGMKGESIRAAGLSYTSTQNYKIRTENKGGHKEFRTLDRSQEADNMF